VNQTDGERKLTET